MEQLRAWVKTQSLGSISNDEVEAHFAGMPPHYWNDLSETGLVWGLETIHRFLAGIATLNTPGTMPVLEWRHLPNRTGTQLMICTWDRLGLLAKAAACLSAANLSIQEARVFTRADNVVLDVFRVWESESRGVAPAEKLEQVGFLLDGALSQPPRFASVWACSRHKFLAPTPLFAPRITFDNEAAPGATVLRIEAADRLGLLYDLLQALADAGFNVTQAEIETDGEAARDAIHITGADGQKLLDPVRLHELRRGLEKAITVSD